MKTEQIFKQTGEHLKNMLKTLGDTELQPRCTNKDGSIRLVKPRDWTSGFFPGCLWLQYEVTKDEFWKESAEKFTKYMFEIQFYGGSHDVGFMMNCSYGNGYRLTDNPEYKKILIQSAETLITRFNPNTGCIRSWDHNTDKWQYPVIIDNMMNLELLFWASKVTGDSKFADIALSHADTTLKNHFRDNNSCYHVIGYDPETGDVLQKHTHQGYGHESTWARGQAWAIYGYTMCYRETGNKEYLSRAIQVTDFIMNHKNLPDDSVPYWDLDDPAIPNAPRDASAGSIICSGLYELSTHLGEEGVKYRVYADKLLATLSSPDFLAKLEENNNFILMHSVGNMPKNDEVDTPINYADYYFLEASLRKMNLDIEGSIYH